MTEGEGVETEGQDHSHFEMYQELSASRIWKEVESAGACLRDPGGPGRSRLLFLEGLVLLDSDWVSVSSSNTESILCILPSKLTLAAEVFMVRST